MYVKLRGKSPPLRTVQSEPYSLPLTAWIKEVKPVPRASEKKPVNMRYRGELSFFFLMSRAAVHRLQQVAETSQIWL